MNLLLTSVGRRAYMVKYFKDVLGDCGQVHVCNSSDLSVAFQYADKSFVSPLIYDEKYIPCLIEYCKENKIEVLISLFDIDLPVLAKNREKFEEIGTNIIVSNEKIVEICNDKWKTYNFLLENGFNVPKTYLSLDETLNALTTGEISYPIIVKPRFGCGSIAMSVAEDRESLDYYCRRNERAVQRTYLKFESDFVENKIIFQEMLKGQEFGADIINDLNADFQNAVIKQKIAMRAGETDIAKIVENKVLFEEAKRLGNLTGHIANMDCDMFMVDGKPYILEMNARFGGGYPFSHVAGVNLPEAIIRWHKGEKVEGKILEAKPSGFIYKELVLTTC